LHRDYEEIAKDLAKAHKAIFQEVNKDGNLVCAWFLEAEISAFDSGFIHDIGACNAVISKLDGHDPKLFRSRSERAISLLKGAFKKEMKNAA